MKVRTKVKAMLFWVFILFVAGIILGCVYYFTFHTALIKFLENYKEVF